MRGRKNIVLLDSPRQLYKTFDPSIKVHKHIEGNRIWVSTYQGLPCWSDQTVCVIGDKPKRKDIVVADHKQTLGAPLNMDQLMQIKDEEPALAIEPYMHVMAYDLQDYVDEWPMIIFHGKSQSAAVQMRYAAWFANADNYTIANMRSPCLATAVVFFWKNEELLGFAPHYALETAYARKFDSLPRTGILKI